MKRTSSRPKRLRLAVASAVVLVATATFAPVGTVRGQQATTPTASNDVIVEPVQGNVHVVMGPKSNSAVQVGDEGVLIVDTNTLDVADRIAAAVRGLSPQPIRQIINTSADDDHTGGNEMLAKSGRAIGNRPAAAFTEGATASVLAHEAVLARMSGANPPVATGRLPIDTFFGKRSDFYFNGEAVELIHVPAAHSDGDVMVMFRRSDVIATGDIFSPERYPAIDIGKGGSVQGLIAGLNLLLDLTVPADKQEGGTMVIAGHGRVSDESEVNEYRDMVTIVRDRIQDMIRKKLTLAQVKAARPTLDYDGTYGTPDVTPDAFIEAVYRSLSQPATARGTK